MIFGSIFMRKRYSMAQMVTFWPALVISSLRVDACGYQTSVVLVTVGVILATLSKPKGTVVISDSTTSLPADIQKYLTGIVMIVTSLFLTGILGILQEKTYQKYGPCWKEAVFYTVSHSWASNSLLAGTEPGRS